MRLLRKLIGAGKDRVSDKNLAAVIKVRQESAD